MIAVSIDAGRIFYKLRLLEKKNLESNIEFPTASLPLGPFKAGSVAPAYTGEIGSVSEGTNIHQSMVSSFFQFFRCLRPGTNQIVDHTMLMLVHPASNGGDQERKWVYRRSHPCVLQAQAPTNPEINDVNQIEFLDKTPLIRLNMAGEG